MPEHNRSWEIVRSAGFDSNRVLPFAILVQYVPAGGADSLWASWTLGDPSRGHTLRSAVVSSLFYNLIFLLWKTSQEVSDKKKSALF